VHEPEQRRLAGLVLAAVIDAMAAGRWERLRACDDCQWVFYDQTRNSSRRWCGMSCPVSSRGLRILVEECLEGVVGGGVVGHVVLPASPDDVRPGAGEDADGVGMVTAAGDGLVVEDSGPGAGAAGVAGEVAQGVSQLLVGALNRPGVSGGSIL
jgi:hypothetical protein